MAFTASNSFASDGVGGRRYHGELSYPTTPVPLQPNYPPTTFTPAPTLGVTSGGGGGGETSYPIAG